MSSYLKQIEVSKELFLGSRFDEMYIAIQKEANKSKWDHNGTVREVRKAKTFSHICKAMGINLIYEGNDSFTIDLDGTYASAFLEPMIESIEQYVNDGEIIVQCEKQRIDLVFKAGHAFLNCSHRADSEEINAVMTD